MRRILLSILFVYYPVYLLHAQNGNIKGIVKDKYTNHPVPFANVLIFNTTTGTQSDSLGQFNFPNIEENFLRIQISSIGYEPFISEVIEISKVKTINVELFLTPSTEVLNEVKVLSNPFNVAPESPLSIQRIGIDLIEKSAGANRDISKVLQLFPGVGNPLTFRNDLIVRGGGPSENRFYLDGVEIPTINHFATQGASGGPVGILNVDFIREVEFYSGAFPASRGNTLSSVVEFSQKEANKEQTSFKGSIGASELSFSVNGPISEKTSLLAGIRRSYLQFLFDQLGLPFLPTFNDFSFKTRTKINRHNEITFLGIGALDQTRLNPEPDPSKENIYILSYIPTNYQWNYTVGSVYKHYLQKSYLTIVLSRSHLYNKAYKYYNNIETPENLNLDYRSNEIENKFRVELTSRPRNFSINVGGNIEIAGYDNYTFFKNYSTDGYIETQYDSKLTLLKWGAFGSISHPFINNRLSLSLGARLDANNYSNEMNNLLKQFSPRFSASFMLTPKLYLNGSTGRYYQQPAYTTMGYKISDQFINRINGLNYIQSNHYVVGMEMRPNDYTRFSIEGFLKNYYNYPFSVSDSVSLASKGSGYGVFGDEEVTSTSKGRAYGFEILLKQRSLKKLSYIIAYTYVRSEFTDINNQFIPSSWDSKHLITATISKKLKRNWDLGIKWRFIGGLPYTPYDYERSSYVVAWNARGREYLDYSLYNTKRLKPFHQLDFRVDKTYNFKKWTLGFYLDIQNLYNKKNQEPNNLTLVYDGNNVPVIINPDATITEQKYALEPLKTTSGTILPTIGVNIEF